MGRGLLTAAISGLRSRLTGPLKLEIAFVAALCVAVFFGAAWISLSVFDRVPHTEDETAFLFQAQTLAAGRVVAEAPAEPEFFSIPFLIVRDGMWFGKYPPGFPLVLAAGVLIGQAWMVNAVLASLCVGVIYVITRRLYGQTIAVLAALLLAVSPFFLLQAGSLLSHIASLFWTLLFLALFSVARAQRGVMLPIIAGAVIGMMFLSRPLSAVGIALPFIIWALLAMAQQRKVIRSYVFIALGALPFVLTFLLYNHYTTGNALHTAYELWWDFDRLGFGPDIGINGHDLDDGLRNTRVNTNALASLLFGWPGRLSLAPAVLTVLLSSWTLVQRLSFHSRSSSRTRRPGGLSPETWDLVLASMVASLIAVHILYWTPGQMYGPRYYMEAVGPLVILSARGFLHLRDAIAGTLTSARVSRFQPLAVANTVAVVSLLLLTMYAAGRSIPEEFDRFTDWNEINRDNVEIVEAANLDSALVFIARRSWTDYAPFFAQNVPSLDSPVVYASDRGNDRNRILMDQYRGRDFYRLEDGQLTSLELTE